MDVAAKSADSGDDDLGAGWIVWKRPGRHFRRKLHASLIDHTGVEVVQLGNDGGVIPREQVGGITGRDRARVSSLAGIGMVQGESPADRV